MFILLMSINRYLQTKRANISKQDKMFTKEGYTEINFWNIAFNIIETKRYTRDISKSILENESNCKSSPPNVIFRHITFI